jgi:predicted nucleotidyltransferase
LVCERKKQFRQTKDVDFAVLVGSQEEYEAVKQYLKQHKNFMDRKANSFVMLTPSGVQVDIQPFGEIAIDDGVSIGGAGLTNIKVNGFMEVYQSGTAEVEIQTDHNFKIATLPSIALLKLIAFDDRPEKRSKDARDVANIIEHFFDLQADFIYNNHADLFSDEDNDQTLQEIAAIVIGREIKAICAGNISLRKRVQRILDIHIGANEDSTFVKNMMAETHGTAEQNVKLLKNLRLPFTD